MRTARLWDARTGPQVAVLTGHEGIVHSASFSPDRTRIVTASDDRTVGIWPIFVDIGALIERSKRDVTRCLSGGERRTFFLGDDPPLWCIEREKWPYTTQEWKAWREARLQGRTPAIPSGDQKRARFESPSRRHMMSPCVVNELQHKASQVVARSFSRTVARARVRVCRAGRHRCQSLRSASLVIVLQRTDGCVVDGYPPCPRDFRCRRQLRLMHPDRRRAPLILVVDDVEETRDCIEQLLAADGYRVHTARSDADAAEAAAWERPDLILLAFGDVAEGAAVRARRIRQRATLDDDVPVVVFCVPMVAQGAEIAVGRGCYMTRPDNFDQLRSLLARLISST